MNRFKPRQYKFTLIFIACFAVSLFLYVEWVAVNFHIQHAKTESQYLSDYTDRAITRVHANPQWFPIEGDVDGKNLGTHRLNVAQSYDQLKAMFPEMPPIEEIEHNKMFVKLLNIRGLLKVPNFVIVRPLLFENGEQFFGYLHVDAELNDERLDQTLVEELQPVLFIALGCIVLMFIVQLRQINSINNTALAMANWADNLTASNSITPAPNFNIPRLNHIAFTINRSLSTLGEVLEKEQSFAKYTSHELRTPVAALSANIELLEMMMKDLSPKERQVLNRMETAIADMKYQMEALLWMSKEIESDTEFQECDVHEMVVKSTEDNHYLLQGKPVITEINDRTFKLMTHPTLFQIVLNNLVRNAYQNTYKGTATITIGESSIIIANKNNQPELSYQRNESFGIGLVLVEKLVHKLNLEIHTVVLDSGRQVTLTVKNEA